MKTISFNSPNPQTRTKKTKSTSKSTPSLLLKYMNSKISCYLSKTVLSIINVGIPLYDPYTILDAPPQYTQSKKASFKTPTSKSVKTLLHKDRSSKLKKAISHKIILADVDSVYNDSRYYVYYDELSKSRSKRKTRTPSVQSRKQQSPYSSK